VLAAALEAEDRERAFRRAVGASMLVHLMAVGIFWWSPLPSRTATLPAVVNVTLVAAAPGAPARPAAPAPPPPVPEAIPEPVPVPIPEPAPVPVPVPDKVLLPKEATKVPKPKPAVAPKPAVEPKPKPRPEPAPRREPVAYDDVLSQLRAEAGEAAPQPVEVAARPSRAPPGGGIGIPISAEEAAWRRQVKVQVTRSWVLEPGMRRQLIETEVRVSIGAGGEVKSVDVIRKSGNPWYDDSVVRAVEKASPLPAPPEVAEWRFVFTPQDLL
jgi:protein TonB